MIDAPAVVKKEYDDIKVCKTKEEAVEFQKKYGGYISTDGQTWYVLFIPKETK